MPRKDALLRLHKSLVAKRDALRKQLLMELDDSVSPDHLGGDLADAALDDSQNEMHSQLAAFESRELEQIEHAIHLLKTGRYGRCEVCGDAIPAARLKAIPNTTVCIDCRQKQELRGGYSDDASENWESLSDYEGRLSDRELTIHDLDVPVD
ncbi:MAG: TraR/DksA family transcriptional regulator [Planctomycetota bacterium]|nr:TraR/DksA family transcriptional regulator [Planctomycetota bacterium]